MLLLDGHGAVADLFQFVQIFLFAAAVCFCRHVYLGGGNDVQIGIIKDDIALPHGVGEIPRVGEDLFGRNEHAAQIGHLFLPTGFSCDVGFIFCGLMRKFH